MLDAKEEFQLQRAYRDAAEKVAAIPGRLKAEFALAEAEKREPFDILPLTEIPANLVVHAIENIKGEVPNELSEAIGVQRRSCRLHSGTNVLLLSVQLKAILDAAGLGKATAEA